MKIEEYKDEYLPGVVACLKRNYPWMGKLSDEALIKWMDPIINYRWDSEHSPEGKRYSKGVVLLNEENNVVGFSGMISSKHIIDGKECLYGDGTTTAVDPKYSFCLGAMLRFLIKAYDYDLLSSYTPRNEVQVILINYFHYEPVEVLGYKFLPFPMFVNRKVKISIICDSSEIEQEDLRVVYDDHVKYGIKCAAISADGKICYLFYKTKTMKFKFIKYRGIFVLYSSDPIMCGEYAKDIIWFLEKNEKAVFDTDSRFFGGDSINYHMPYFKRIRARIRLEKKLKDNDSFFPYGLLYSELSILL